MRPACQPGELKRADVFWMGLRKLSLLISLHGAPHAEEPVSFPQCDCMGRADHQWLTK